MEPGTSTWTSVWAPMAGAGRAHRRGFPTKKAAQEELDRLRHSVATATYVAPKRQTIADYLTDDWLPAVRHNPGPLNLGDLRAQHPQPRDPRPRSSTDPTARRRGPQPLIRDPPRVGSNAGQAVAWPKARTVRYIHTILHASLDDAVRWRRLVVNPAAQATPPSAALAKAPEMRVWTGTQVRRFLELCGNDRYLWPWLFLATTGYGGAKPSDCVGRTSTSIAP